MAVEGCRVGVGPLRDGVSASVVWKAKESVGREQDGGFLGLAFTLQVKNTSLALEARSLDRRALSVACPFSGLSVK
jgi:hypothetical protein